MKVGKESFKIESDVRITSTYTIAGPMEGNGNFGSYYDIVLENDEWGCDSHEKCETKMHKEAIKGVMEKAKATDESVDMLFGGDLLNQIIATSYSARDFDISYVGLYGACSTFGLSLAVGAMLIGGNYIRNGIVCTSSHYATAERQYRYPLELGTQPTPSSQWTVTGAGASFLEASSDRTYPKITGVTIGRVIDMGINDANNMGAAMAPSCADTIMQHLSDFGRDAEYYDMIISGDLGKYGRQVLHYLCKQNGYELANVLNDAGAMIYNDSQKKSVQGGSGAGCSSIVFNSYFYKEMMRGNFKKILLVPTGALLSKIETLQGETIPAVSHAIAIEMDD
ncbi:MAG: stage V sporulation protein AD [Clostridia bacterium]|jgi:stage V sporulation protein AD|nr:stage V sporulation protein AD [Clostridia bacterium]